ncbi:MAG: flavodoxin-dependent (E)-4-hydroxy-3-methylbut-2-enyl-diphosphate synthase [Actinomycetota bacterium]|nr:flavodoxin-dependent (E)-4-hydroxy-3-methylbut-2-enyl-diphosphate synthase [Actinomycetota bacterium]MDK1017605.1 flavodoxin-dependent (E)-4-hydroxy-3-methylbut-2-enyl-diphosphate synthase [Actinomycetota bacterium]MDK1026777.1 flavodoxin-dependent (E)-4-hydroxy-3-methylbut-2-enyl-diphosphate synthase [Actinomycetota bacterium]MDK1038860.1 flavodoxin-dependent (E)-4-hydroxy-3-methylbut-2-enyl-diphosphate synthase [Actinomycetota bacterium]MDK1096355.1 flavodoxin-dependent (E)-4-hydroxy-3-met
MVFERRKTRKVRVGGIEVGGGAPISVQSMTTTKTADVEATLTQIYALAGAGADIVRVTCNTVEAAQGIAEIMPRSPVPIVADIHFQYRLALASIEAGVSALRLNPGNIRNEAHIKTVATAAKEAGIPIRIGVNAGSLDKDLLAKYGSAVPQALVDSAMQEIKYFDDIGFHDVKISVKHSNVPLMVEAYRLLADVTDYPLHLGVTEAGPLPGGLIKGVAGIATLLNEGIGDTIRFSLTADPVEEAKTGRALLEYLGLRERTTLDFIACPSCGRAEVDVIKVATEANERLEELDVAIQVAVMGCVVNGPGEAREADLGLAAGRGRGHLFIKGEVVRVVPEAEMVDALIEEAKLLVEQGVEARLAAADVSAADVAEETRVELLSIQGDVNRTEEKRAAVADVAQGSDTD